MPIDCFYLTGDMKARQPANTFKILRRASARERLGASLVASSIVLLFAGLWALQTVHFDFGLIVNPCGFKQRTGWPCPACGMTTSVLAFARGRIIQSFYTQPAAALGCLVLIAAAFLALPIAVFGVYFKALDGFFHELKVSHLVISVLVITAAGWAVTLARAFMARNTG